MDPSQYVLLLAVITGVTELISRVRASDWWVVLTIAIAAGVGGVFGATHYYADLDIVEGIVAGFAAAGVLKGLSVFGNKTTPAPSKAVQGRS